MTSHLSNSLTRKSSGCGGERLGHQTSRFPFKIEDIPGQQTIVLTREYQDELLKVEVSMPDLDPGEEPEEDDDGNFNYDTRRKVKPSEAIIPLVVTVTENSGTSL